MEKNGTRFLVVNNLLVVTALVGAAFDLPGVYTPFFAISVALQIHEVRKLNSKR